MSDIRSFFGGPKPKKAKPAAAAAAAAGPAKATTKPKAAKVATGKKTKSPAKPKTKTVADKKTKSAKKRSLPAEDDDDDDFTTKPAKTSPQKKPKPAAVKPAAAEKGPPQSSEPTVISDEDEDEDDEAAALAMLEGDDDDDNDDEVDQAAALAMLESDEDDEVQETAISPKKVAVKVDLSEFSNTSSVNSALTSARASSPKKPKVESPVKPKKRAMGWGDDAVKALTKNAPGTNDEPPKKKANHWRNLKNRAGPSNLGGRPIPVGKPNCLAGLKFVRTGELECFGQDQVVDLLKKYGGTVVGSVSKKTDYVVVGRDAGPSKLQKIEDLKIKTLDEDAFVKLIETRQTDGAAAEAMEKKFEDEARKEAAAELRAANARNAKIAASMAAIAGPSASQLAAKPKATNGTPGLREDGANSMLWSVKYAPIEAKRVAGQQGGASNMKKLQTWLTGWHQNRQRVKNTDPKKMPKKASDTGWEFKAILMAGPPGVGKTTTAHLVCNELGYEAIEMNASDCRNKSTLAEHVMTLLGNTSVTQFYTSSANSGKKAQKKALIMDEVDGMGGNADRGGMAELIQLIKKTKIPVICMANDKDSQKMRSLKNHVYVNNFRKMQAKQLVGAVRTILFKEGIKIDQPALLSIIEGTNCDMRQILNNLEMWSHTAKHLTFDGVKGDIADTTKNVKENPFQFVGQFFSPQLHQKRMDERINLYFNDYSLSPLFVQEMYLKANMNHHNRDRKSQYQVLAQLSMAADSIADGDLINTRIYSNQDFKLLPVHAVASCIRPGFLLKVGLGGRIDFPQVLGKTSTKNKFNRLLSELRQHMRTHTSADSEDMRMNYMPYMRHRLVQPLVNGAEGCNEEVHGMMDTYSLSRDDWDSLNELCQMKPQTDPTKSIDTKVKSAFTREYNKKAHAMPYAQDAGRVKKKRAASSTGAGADEDLEGLFEEDADDADDMSGFKAKAKPKGKAKAKGKKKK